MVHLYCLPPQLFTNKALRIPDGELVAQNSTEHMLTEKERAQFIQNAPGGGLHFTENKGQIADMEGKPSFDVLYKGDGAGADIYLRKTGISYVQSNMNEVMNQIEEQVEDLIKAGSITERDEQKKKDELMQKAKIKIHRVDMDYEGANTDCKLINEGQVDGNQNFYYGHCPQGITNVHQYNKVTYKNIYNNIDIIYYGDKINGIKYDFIVNAHANPNQIKLHWKGAESISLNRKGNLIIKTSVNEFYESIPKVYQNKNGKIVDVPAKYELTHSISGIAGEVIVSFSLGEGWDESFPLIIDPWATYYGGTGSDIGIGLAGDVSGNIYLTGSTTSLTNIAFLGHQMASGVRIDAFLVKFNSVGVRQWATYYGGSGGGASAESGTSVTVDVSGNVYMAGYTDSPNNISSAGHQMMLGGFLDAFLVKFNNSGVRQWATYYGGTGWDRGFSVCCDASGNIYLAGDALSPNNISAGGGHQIVSAGGVDAFLVKFDSAGIRQWSTYYGGTAEDRGYNVACDASGNVYLSGKTSSLNNIFSAGHQPAYGGSGYDAFLVKFNTNGARQWGTYYGGTSWDIGCGLACDTQGNVYLAGYTVSPNNISWLGDQISIGGGSDAFLVKFNSSGIRQWGTYYGGALAEMPELDYGGNCLALDVVGNFYLYMEIEDNPGPSLDPCSYQPNHAGGIEDQMIVKYTPAGNKICATYFGGPGYDELDYGGGIAVSGNSLYITGQTKGNYPVTTGVAQTVYGGGASDAFLTNLCLNICEGKTLGVDYIASPNSVCANTPITFTPSITNTCDTAGYKFQWVFTGGSPASSDSIQPTVTFSDAGTYNVKLVVTTLCKKDSITKTNYITINPCNTCNLTGQFTKGTSNCATCGCKEWIMITGSGGTEPYSYTWPNGYTNRYKNKLCAGNYIVNIKDKNGCSVNVNLTAP